LTVRGGENVTGCTARESSTLISGGALGCGSIGSCVTFGNELATGTLGFSAGTVAGADEGVAAGSVFAGALGLCATTVPGIGAHRALLICAEALPITRFRTPGHLASYAGLVPCSTQTGQRGVQHGPLPAGANRWLRGALVRAVVSHVQHAPGSWLTAYYTTQKARLGWPVARVAAARKLTRALHAMLRTHTPWRDTPEGESSDKSLPSQRPLTD